MLHDLWILLNELVEFLAMGGYGFYVWGSYLATLIAIGGEIFFLWRRKKSLKRAGLNIPEINTNEETS